ncbi:MAG TPA: hypothetical protein VFO10_28160 [Oligoflexus sp.]|uniref:hypothetical protein n=1 Tax=Oligoflexus sp. TaxID=1971216 RepID=UPI002D7FE8D1|nr:hypothetical protein [Oligoflexus sp.]HET9241172.1 hypothetical protein [Oligoflexus sp.]
MLNRFLFTLALVSQLFACGQETVPENATTPVPEPAKYPRSMPQSNLDDSRLIGYWETLCEVSASGSTRWSFLLDPTKAVLEKQVYQDAQCGESSYIARYYMTYTAADEKLDGRIWEVHASIRSQDTLNTLFHQQSCSLPTVRDELWYDLTGSRCTMNDAPASVERGSALIASAYSISLNKRQLTLDVAGKAGLKFKKID